jgi:hypothetical protein
MNKYRNIDFKSFLAQFDEDFIQQMQAADDKRNEADFASLKENLAKGKCYICDCEIESFDADKPCLHWLLNPKIKKNLLTKMLMNSDGFFSLYTYLAWVANTERFFVNINDKLSELWENRKFEASIKYKEFIWSFCIAASDLEGHENSSAGNMPHFHFSMTVNDRPIISFNQLHIPFTDNDLFNLEMIRQKAAIPEAGFGSGLQFLNEVDPNEFHDALSRSDNLDNASFRTRTFINRDTLDEQKWEKIMELRRTTNMALPAIISKLNKEYGFGIEYACESVPIEPTEMIHRNKR